MTRRLGVGALVGLALGAGPPTLVAQISPGKLSRAHASLEGSGQCLKCHDMGKGPAAEKCLACHRALGERVAAGRGLHARSGYQDCKRCHVEHQGVEYELVWWGKEGREAFDHRLSGYSLEGKHAHLTCPACHQERFHRDTEKLAGNGVTVSRTFLGLGTACVSCHPDEHRGQLAERECASCHVPAGWRPAPGFDHGRTGYALTGRHAAVACAGCHKTTARDAGGAFRTFKGLASRDCTACHEDAHRGRFGSDCARCHTTESWKRYNTARFDHDKTGYPLRGRHAGVACDRCHSPGRPRKLRHGSCSDCHADAHLGQLAGRADRGRCESCHDLAGFSPTRFTVEEHQKTGFALAGAHLAVPCVACHRRVGREAIARLPGVRVPAAAGSVVRATQLRFASTRCTDCHRDPHRGEVDRFVRTGGCEACHRVESWRQVRFDHAQTRFALTGGHARVPCGSCHKKVEAGTPRERVRFTGVGTTCGACHKDPHPGQFVRSAGAWPCERCHVTEDWRTSRFDHAQTSFHLDGAHARTSCTACHKKSAGSAAGVARRALPTACKDCHAGGVPAQTTESRP